MFSFHYLKSSRSLTRVLEPELDVDGTVALEVHESRRSAKFFLEPLGGYGGTSWLVPHPLFRAAVPATDDSTASFLESDQHFRGGKCWSIFSQQPSRTNWSLGDSNWMLYAIDIFGYSFHGGWASIPPTQTPGKPWLVLYWWKLHAEIHVIGSCKDWCMAADLYTHLTSSLFQHLRHQLCAVTHTCSKDPVTKSSTLFTPVAT